LHAKANEPSKNICFVTRWQKWCFMTLFYSLISVDIFSGVKSTYLKALNFCFTFMHLKPKMIIIKKNDVKACFLAVISNDISVNISENKKWNDRF
jgi:hypothetical protein